MSSTYLKAVFEGCIASGAPEALLLSHIEGGHNGLKNPSRRYPARLVAEILNAAVEATGKQNLAVQIGAMIRPEIFLDISYALPFCNDLREVIVTNKHYQPLIQQNGVTDLVILGERARLEWQPHYQDVEFYRYFVEMIFSGYASIGRWLLWGKANPVLSMQFRHSRPDDIAMHQVVFNEGVKFGAEQDAVEFMSDAMDAPMPDRNPDMLNFLKKRLDIQLAELESPVDIVTETLRCIQSSLANGRPVLSDISTILGMSDRTLRRRLLAKGESFRTVLERARKDSCDVYLREKKYGHAEIAQLLGFSDQSAYSRAFKLWFDMTPRQYQAQLENSG